MKGTPNAVPTRADLRTMIREALELEGGVEYLRRQARRRPGPFLLLLARLVPAELKAAIDVLGQTTVIQVITGFDSGPHDRSLAAGMLSAAPLRSAQDAGGEVGRIGNGALAQDRNRSPGGS